MGDLARRIAATEHWPELAETELAGAVGHGPPLAVFFPGAAASRRETDDVAVVLRELARAGHVRAATIGAGEGAAKRRFGVVAAPSLLVMGRGGTRVVPLIADWGDYLTAIEAVAAPATADQEGAPA
jgi:hypothetical protein